MIEGATVVFPTDTIYGLGANPLSTRGVQRCFEIKNRAIEKKLPVLFSSTTEAEKLVRFDERASLIAARFWPGRVSLVLPVRRLSFPPELCDDGTLAVRVPNHECCLRLISSCGHSLIGTSANISGQSSFVDSNDPLLVDFASRADYFVKGECGKSALPSTILDLSRKDRVTILREGAVPSSKILQLLGEDKQN